MRITELFTAQSIALDEALTDQEQIISRLVELQATHGNITDKDAYKKALYAREAEGSTYVDNGITVPHAKTNVVTRPSLAALRLSSPVQYNAEDDGTTDLLFAIAAPENGSLHVDMLARMMQMLMNEDFVAKLKAAKTPAEFLDCIDAQEEAQFGAESFTQQEIPQSGYRILAVTASTVVLDRREYNGFLFCWDGGAGSPFILYFFYSFSRSFRKLSRSLSRFSIKSPPTMIVSSSAR